MLHRALRHAVQWQAIPVNPADVVDRPSIPAATPRTLDPAEATALLVALDGHRHGLPLRTALMCGLRLSELLGLHDNVTPLGPAVRVPRDALRRWIDEQSTGGAPAQAAGS